MLKNKIIFKRIRNICILVMAVAILVGAYTYVRRSRAENIIQIELEVSDKSETLEAQKIIVDATGTEDGNYLLDLPTSVNGNMVTKYYMADGSEVDMIDENANKTLTLTEADITNQPMQLQTDYDKKEIATEDGQTITLYNKELMDVKDTEEDANAEGTDNGTQANETQTNETTENGETSEVTGEEGATEETANETTTDEATQKPELDDTVIVTGYMPLETQVDIKEMDVSTLPEIQLANENQTIQKAYEVSVYQTQRRTFDAEGNMITEEIVKPESNIDNGTNNKTEENIIDNTTEENATNSTTDLMAIENITSENAKENENVTSVTEATTPDNTTITTIMLNDGTRIEEEKIEYDPSVYNEQLTIKTKNTEANTIATIYELQDDNQVISLESTNEEDYVDTTIEKDNQVARLALATEPNLQNEAAPNSLNSDSGISTMATMNMLVNTSEETGSTDGFLGNTNIQRQYIDNVTFVSSTTGANSTAWDVSATHNGSIMAWYETNANGSYKVYIGSNEQIYAATDSSYLFAWIGFSERCTSTETITNLHLLNTSQVYDMSYMFASVGYNAMTKLDLGDNFDTSNVTDMSAMFQATGVNAMTSLDLGDNFDTSNVTDMHNMFYATGRDTMTGLYLGESFTRIAEENTEMFHDTGKIGSVVISVPEEIYQDKNHFKLNNTSTTTISFTNGTIQLIGGNPPVTEPGTLRSTSSESGSTQNGFLGNTNIQRR